MIEDRTFMQKKRDGEGMNAFGATRKTCVVTSVSLGVDRKLYERVCVASRDVWSRNSGYEEEEVK